MNKIHFYLSASVLISGLPLGAIDPTFHLKNNSTGIIQINLTQGGKSLFTLKPTHLRPVSKGKEFAFQVDVSKPTALELYYCPTAESCKTKQPEKLIARFTENKPIFIKFDNKKIEPQKGNPITGKSTSGYNMKNNVTIADISVIKAKPGSVTLSPQEISAMMPAQSQKEESTKKLSSSQSSGVRGFVGPNEIVPYTDTQSSEEHGFIGSNQLVPAASYTTDIVPVAQAQPRQSRTSRESQLQSVGKQTPTQANSELQQQEPVTMPLTAAEKRGLQAPATAPMQQSAETISTEGVAKEAPLISSAQFEQPAKRIAPTAPTSKKQDQESAGEITKKAGLQESVEREKMAQSEPESLRPDALQLAWLEFPEANLLRKKLKNGDQSPFVARKVLALGVGASEADITKSAKKLDAFYSSRSYRGDISLVPDIRAIVAQSKQILIDAMYPPLSSSKESPFRQELLQLFSQAPDGFEEFAAPIYQDLMDKKQYSRDFLQTIQKKVMGKSGLPEKWKQSVLSKLQRELSRIK